MGAPLHLQLPGAERKKRATRGAVAAAGFQAAPRQKGAEEWFGSKHPFLLIVGFPAHKGLRTLAADSPGHHVLAARHSVAAGKHDGSVFAESGTYGGLLLSLFTAFLALIKSVIGRSLKECRPGSFGWVHFNSNPVIQFTSTTGLQVQVHMADVKCMLYALAQRRFEGNSWRILS